MNLKQITIASLILSSVSFGASIDLVQNYSAEYAGNPAQQGAINYGSTVYFNPAGLSQLEQGTYFVGGVQVAFGEQSMAEGKEYDADLFSPIPNFAVYKVIDDGAYFWTLGAVAGGATLEYKDGVPLPNMTLPNGMSVPMNSLLEGTNVKGGNQYAQTTFGRTWKVNEKLSTSLGLRAVYGLRTLEASTSIKNGVKVPVKLPTGLTLVDVSGHSASIDSERTGYGFGFQLGLNYKATEKLNLGLRYDSQINMKFKTDATINPKGMDINNIGGTVIVDKLLRFFPVYADGLKTRRDLPAILALGASYKVTDRWTTFVGGNYYFNKDATMDQVGKLKNYDYSNGWEISVGSEYWINDKFAWLVGANYADTGAPEGTYSPTEYAINSIFVGTGIKYRQNETTEWTVAFNQYFYDSTNADNVVYEKEISSIGFNFVKKF
ncbi:OmpP1/FadL family transporter [uncultured Fusobacterium sp.]|uniref:OmpP1/FadL family transporter n=1 Tax=uncultured Fusobacterium sp. TaxID=159267 RepID=UPI0015A6C513|nr:outer membrane protein transport protein [uncultured Fusobacterium sp.]